MIGGRYKMKASGSRPNSYQKSNKRPSRKNPEGKLVTMQVVGDVMRIGAIRRLRFSQDVDNRVRCTLDNGIDTGAQTTAEFDVSGYVQVRPDLTIYNEGAVFQSLVIYR